jgi:hypothetical protein
MNAEMRSTATTITTRRRSATGVTFKLAGESSIVVKVMCNWKDDQPSSTALHSDSSKDSDYKNAPG